MHIQTHKDRIWLAGCQEKENRAKELLDSASIQHCLVDAWMGDPHENLATDNHFRYDTQYINLAPQFWNIYLCNKLDDNVEPVHDYCCFMNRISGERLLVLYRLYLAQLLNKGIVGFNCLYHDMDPTVEQRQQNFEKCHQDVEPWLDQYWPINQVLQHQMPMVVDHDPDSAALHSKMNFVIETYVNDTVIAFSEKIFRALQTPRPWVLFCSPDSVKTLREYGFDVLDDIVDHGYDHIENAEDRLNHIIEMLRDPKPVDKNRCNQAVEHNQRLLASWQTQWNSRIYGIVDRVLIPNKIYI